MAPEKLTEYERKRLENIRRNDQVLASLKIHSKIAQLSSVSKRQRAESKSYKLSPEKKSKTQSPLIIRRSLRTRGIAPTPDYANGVEDDLVQSKTKLPKSSPTKTPSYQPVPISTKDAYRGGDSDRALVETIVGVSEKSEMGFVKNCAERVALSGLDDDDEFDLSLFSLESENVARVMPGRIMSVKFFPANDLNMIVAGNKFGDLAFWNVDSGEEDQNGIYLYHPHSAPVSGISIQPFALSKIITSSYDGFIRMMDAEKEVFDLLYNGEGAIHSLSQSPNDSKCIYFGEGNRGELNVFDERAGKCSNSWISHEARINSIDFTLKNSYIMATSSTDGTACIWDLRSMSAHKSKSLKTVNHKKAVHSAYFSPSGSSIATTSVDNTVGILNGVNYEDEAMIYHNNWTGRWVSSFRGVWGWDDSHVFIGNMKRGVDVISAKERQIVKTLESEHMSAIPCRFDTHPSKVGSLAGATSGGQIYFWTSS